MNSCQKQEKIFNITSKYQKSEFFLESDIKEGFNLKYNNRITK